MQLKSRISVGLAAAALAGVMMNTSESTALNCDGPIQDTWSRTSTCPSSVNPDGISQGFFGSVTGRELKATLSTSVEPRARARGFNAAGKVRCSVTDVTNNGDANGDIRSCPSDVVRHLIQVF